MADSYEYIQVKRHSRPGVSGYVIEIAPEVFIPGRLLTDHTFDPFVACEASMGGDPPGVVYLWDLESAFIELEIADLDDPVRKGDGRLP